MTHYVSQNGTVTAETRGEGGNAGVLRRSLISLGNEMSPGAALAPIKMIDQNERTGSSGRYLGRGAAMLRRAHAGHLLRGFGSLLRGFAYSIEPIILRAFR